MKGDPSTRVLVKDGLDLVRKSVQTTEQHACRCKEQNSQLLVFEEGCRQHLFPCLNSEELNRQTGREEMEIKIAPLFLIKIESG